MFYFGRARKLRNRLQQSHMFEKLLNNEKYFDICGCIGIAAWYMSYEEAIIAEGAMINAYPTIYNNHKEGAFKWKYRDPDIPYLHPLTIRPHERKDWGGHCILVNKPGIYLWYAEPMPTHNDFKQAGLSFEDHFEIKNDDIEN